MSGRGVITEVDRTHPAVAERAQHAISAEVTRLRFVPVVCRCGIGFPDGRRGVHSASPLRASGTFGPDLKAPQPPPSIPTLAIRPNDTVSLRINKKFTP